MARKFHRTCKSVHWATSSGRASKKSGLTAFDSSTIRPAICPAKTDLRASLDTVVMMSFRPGGTDHGSAGQAARGEGGPDSQWNGVDDHEVVVKERVAVCEHLLSRVTCECALDADIFHSVIVAVSGRCDPSIYLLQRLFPCEVYPRLVD
jgi:hypothetical protein